MNLKNCKHLVQVFLLVKVEGQHFLIFSPIHKTISRFYGLSDTISEWESKGLLNEKVLPPYTVNKNLSPKLVW